MRARRGGECPLCHRAIRQGQEIRSWRYGWWVHGECRAAAAATERVREGQTFAGTPREYRRRVRRRD